MPRPIEVNAHARHPLGMSPTRFLRDYWQKQPLLMRGAFADFANPLTPNDLAGLACEELALARIAIHEPKLDQWILRNGPFAEGDYAALPKTHWTLLVQDVDKWDADVAALLAHFAFLPSWRIDDVMVSYAEDSGSVGPHVDQYDVFLLQGLGRRHWQIDARASIEKSARGGAGSCEGFAYRDDTELKLLREFTPTHEWILEPGDMLYLPPGVPHHGVAIGACMTYSIGMRAPSRAELLVDFAEVLADTLPEELRLTDPDLAPARDDGEIDDAAITRVIAAMPWLRWPDDTDAKPDRTSSWRLRTQEIVRTAELGRATPAGKARVKPQSTASLQMDGAFAAHRSRQRMRDQRDDDAAGQLAASLRIWFGRFITRYRSAHVIASNSRALTDGAFMRAVERAMEVQRNPWSRFAWMRDGRGAMLFVAGESFACSLRLARLVCTHPVFPLTQTPAAARDRVTLRALIDGGHLALLRPRRQRIRR